MLTAAAATVLLAAPTLAPPPSPASSSSSSPPPQPALDPSCSSCEGAVDGTLGRCEGFPRESCRSTFDDRPPYFAAPWEFGRDVYGTADALDAIERAVIANGGDVELRSDDAGYLRAVVGGDKTIVLEFLARGEDDAVCEVRATVRGSGAFDRGGRGGMPPIISPRTLEIPGQSAAEKCLTRIRRWLGWAEVPVLRNRTPKIMGYFETPFDEFGPVPPPTMDYRGMHASSLDDPLQ